MTGKPPGHLFHILPLDIKKIGAWSFEKIRITNLPNLAEDSEYFSAISYLNAAIPV
jgi:hypothetical protein